MATLDVLTFEEATAALKGVRGGSELTRVASLLTAISRRLDDYCGPIVKRAVTDTFVGQTRGALYLSGKAYGGVLTTVTEAYSSETPVAVVSTDYVVDDGPTAAVSRWAGYWAPRVVVTYEAGRFASTETVEPLFKEAAMMLLQHMWRPAVGARAETYELPGGGLAEVPGSRIPSFGLPNVVKDLLADEKLPPAVA